MMRKTKIRRYLALLLLPVLVLGILSGCSKEKPVDSDTTTADPVPVIEEAHIDASSLSEYSVIIPKYASKELKDAVVALKSALDAHYGLHLSMSDDEYRFFAKDKTVKPCEILIGSTNRDETIAFQKNLCYDACGWELIGKKLVICGGTDKLTAQAVEAFAQLWKEKADDAVFYSNVNDKLIPGGASWEQADYTVAGLPLKEYRIVYSGTDIRTAENLRDRIGAMTGICVPIVESGTLDKDNPVPSLLVVSPEKVDKSLADTTEYDFSEYAYEVKTLKDVPQIVFGGETTAAVLYAEKDFCTDLIGQKSIGSGRIEKVYAGIDTPEVKKEIPVGGVTLAGGDLSEYRIVCAADAPQKVRFAADELSAYLAKATGITVPVVTDDVQDGEDREIVVGITNRDTEAVKSRRAKLENDGILYYMEGNRLFIGSHTDAGQMYAVYHFLEEKIGCRFYAYDYETIHNSGVITIPSDLDYTYSSPLFYRLTDWIINARKFGVNASEDPMYIIVGGSHTLGELSETGDGMSRNPCLSNEEIYQTVLKNVRARIEANPGCRVISVTQNDNDAHCGCEKCFAAEKAENPSGLMLTFINRLAEDIEKDYPEVKILTFAYQYTRKPPKTIKARDNVLIWLCSVECCFNHLLDDPGCEINSAFVSDIEMWADHCNQMYIWDYTTNYSFFCYPFPDFGVLRQNMRFFVDHDALGVFEEGIPEAETGEFNRLRCYLIRSLLWNPYMTEEEYYAKMDEFLKEYYGAGWQYIRYYIDAMCYGRSTCMPIMRLEKPDDYQFTTDWMKGCFDRAIEAAQDEETRLHCEISSLQTDSLYIVEDKNGSYSQDGSFSMPEKMLEKVKSFGISRVGLWRNIEDASPIPEE